MHQKESAASLVMSRCSLLFNKAVAYEPPLYLFPELLDKRPAPGNGEDFPTIEVTDCVTAAVSLDDSHWFICAAEKPLSDETDANSAHSSAQLSPAMELTRLVLQGAFTSIHLNTDLLNSENPDGFTPNNFTTSLHRLVDEVLIAERSTTRSIINRPLSKSEADEEANSLRRVVFSKHFVHVLAYQRLLELVHSRKRQCIAKVEDSSTDMHQAEGATELLPSNTPWQCEYDGSFVACPEIHAEERTAWYRTLAKHLRSNHKSWSTKTSISCQTDEDLRHRAAGVTPTCSPLADADKACPPVGTELLSTLAQKLSQRLAGFYKIGESELLPSASWLVVVTSSNSNAPSNRSRYVLDDCIGQLCTFGRDDGYCDHARVRIDCPLGDKTAAPKRISPHHCTLMVTAEGLIFSVHGRNGARVVGRRHLLAGHAVTLARDGLREPQRIALVADLSLELSFIPQQEAPHLS